jgi:putative cardiolipin synthase
LPPTNAGALYDFSRQVAQTGAANEAHFLPLSNNMQALRWRLLLADLAQRSIDIQYYLIDQDESSRLLGLHLKRAADRGVRVRILVDDVFLTSSDEAIAIWNSHPNITVHVFNPWHKRGSLFQQALEFIGHPERLNRRMHNKLFAIDGLVAITGGRNIGDAYFGIGSKYNFRDLEVILTGPIVSGIIDSFDLYWNDDWTMSAEAFAAAVNPSVSIDELFSKRKQKVAASEILARAGYLEASLGEDYLAHFIEHAHHGAAWVAYDDPPSVVLTESGVRKIDQLEDLDADISRELLIVSPYFIPSEWFLDKLHGLTKRGVRVAVLTNSMASTNHTIVNSGYRPWRKKLIRAGVELYEYRSDATDTADILASGTQGKFFSLHSKTFLIDREVVYIGSLNMDPRSFHLNTEMGLMITSPALAGEIAGLVERDMSPRNAWQVSLDEEGRLVWHSAAGTTSMQPARHFGQRIADFFFGLLPIKDQL